MHVEGRSVAVNITVALPATPATGTLDRVPMGGDGFYAPQAAYSIKTMSVTGDVSGGAASLRIEMDERFCALVGFAAVQIAQGTAADADVRWLINGNTIASVVSTPTLNSVASTVTSFEVGSTFVPPPILIPGGPEAAALSVFLVNVDADVFYLDAYIYLFNLRARELTPMGPLLWARGSN